MNLPRIGSAPYSIMDVGALLGKVCISSCLLLVIYLVGLGVYRLYLSPLAQYPGPKLAALSNWYEFYYDVILQGKFTFHIRDLHKQYGMALYSSECMQTDTDVGDDGRSNHPYHTHGIAYR